MSHVEHFCDAREASVSLEFFTFSKLREISRGSDTRSSVLVDPNPVGPLWCELKTVADVNDSQGIAVIRGGAGRGASRSY